MAATLVSGDFLWVTLLAALVGVVIGEAGLRLSNHHSFAALEWVGPKLAARRGSFILLIIFSVALVNVVSHKSPNNEQPTSGGGIFQRTNAIVRTGNMPYVFFEHITVQGCKDPADTLLWINIVTGRLYETEEVKDGSRQVKPGTAQQVSDGISAFHRDKWKGCHTYQNSSPVLVEGAARTLDGVEMLCLTSTIDGTCDWVPANEIDLKSETNKK